MSTYQPPGGQPPEVPPPYTPPQDPWATGQGLASVPTDPIPQQYDPYAHAGGGAEVWSQPTVAHAGQPYDYPPQPKSRALLIVGVFLAVLVFGGGGGVAAYLVIKGAGTAAGVDPTSTGDPSSAQSSTPAATSTAFDPHQVAVGDCLVNNGTAKDPEMGYADCTEKSSYKVIKKVEGASIVENSDGLFDDQTSVAACAGTGYQAWYGYKDAISEERDLFFCLTVND